MAHEQYCKGLKDYLVETEHDQHLKCKRSISKIDQIVLMPAITSIVAISVVMCAKVFIHDRASGTGLLSQMGQLGDSAARRPASVLIFALVISIISSHISPIVSAKFASSKNDMST
jgi:hypothetical protein